MRGIVKRHGIPNIDLIRTYVGQHLFAVPLTQCHFGTIGRMQMAIQPISENLETLRSQAAEQGARLRKYEEQIHDRKRHIKQTLDTIQLPRQKRIGRSADAVSKDQLKLFDEAELETLIGAVESEVGLTGTDAGKQQYATRQDKPKRPPLPAHLKRVEWIIDLPKVEPWPWERAGSGSVTTPASNWP